MVDILDAMIDGWVNQIVMVIGQMPWLGPLLALIAGVLAAFTPCCLSSIPLIVGYISGLGEKTTKRAFLYSLTFAGGTACTFVALGLIATSVGHLLGTDSVIWHIILGLLMFLMALQIWDVINIIPETDVLEKKPAWVRRRFSHRHPRWDFCQPLLNADPRRPSRHHRRRWTVFLGHPAHALLRRRAQRARAHRRHLRRFRAAPQRQRPL